MKKTSGDLFIWPDNEDRAWVSVDQIVCRLQPPDLANKREQFRFKNLIDSVTKGLEFPKTAIHLK